MGKVRCKNCGDWTNMPSTAKGERAKRGWCAPCMAQYDKYARQDNRGGEYWVEPKSMYARKPFDSRGDA